MISTDEIAVSVSSLSKMFKVYCKPADMFWELVSSRVRHKEFWALRDVSFEIRRGQVVGIIGRNGAGKSTLLKIITGTLDNTSGSVQVNGRISSILELGTGFNAEYTGRENIYLGGMIVGLGRQELRSKIDWIIDFSELRDVIDQPFKTYSSGMQARLTFATAVCIDPDILIVDEVLSVGDARFQRKSFDKINEFRRNGHTILLVSHNTNTISTFCDHAIFLENGRIVDQGEPYRVSQVYYKVLFCMDNTTENDVREPSVDCKLENYDDSSSGTSSNTGSGVCELERSDISLGMRKLRRTAIERLEKPVGVPTNDRYMRMGNRKIEIIDFGIRDANGKRVAILNSRESYTFFMIALFHYPVEVSNSGFLIRNIHGVDIFGTTMLLLQNLKIPKQTPGSLIEINMDVVMWLTNGIYFLTFSLADPLAENDVQFDIHYDALQFEVTYRQGIFTTSMVDLEPKISMKHLGNVLVES